MLVIPVSWLQYLKSNSLTLESQKWDTKNCYEVFLFVPIKLCACVHMRMCKCACDCVLLCINIYIYVYLVIYLSIYLFIVCVCVWVRTYIYILCVCVSSGKKIVKFNAMHKLGSCTISFEDFSEVSRIGYRYRVVPYRL